MMQAVSFFKLNREYKHAATGPFLSVSPCKCISHLSIVVVFNVSGCVHTYAGGFLCVHFRLMHRYTYSYISL